MNAPADDEDTSSIATPLSSLQGARNIHLSDNRIDSRDLFVATREITIAHGAEIYRLRLTAQNKLILTK